MTQTTVTIAKDRYGDFHAHLGGCADLKRGSKYEGGTTYRGADLLAAIIAADTKMADWFGQKPYEPDHDDVPWQVAGITWAPCFTAAVQAAGIKFDDPAGGWIDYPDTWAGGTGRPTIS